MSVVATYAFTRAHTSVYVSDKLRKLLTLLVRNYGLEPVGIADAWTDCVGQAVRTWLQSGHLRAIVLEFYRPGFGEAEARWDFPIRFDGSGIDDDMWVDRAFLEDSLGKARVPPSDCLYRIVLDVSPGHPVVPGMVATVFRSTDTLVAREIGTVIATPDIMASGRYYR